MIGNVGLLIFSGIGEKLIYLFIYYFEGLEWVCFNLILCVRPELC